MYYGHEDIATYTIKLNAKVFANKIEDTYMYYSYTLYVHQ